MTILLTSILEAIAEIEKFRIGKDEMIILAPENTMNKVSIHEFEENGGVNFICCNAPGKISKLQGVLVVEDESISEIIVKSLISEHRIVVGVKDMNGLSIKQKGFVGKIKNLSLSNGEKLQSIKY